MGLLRFILNLPWLLARWLSAIVRGVLAALGWLLAPIVGRVSWQAPGWLNATGTRLKNGSVWMRQHPLRFGGGLVGVIGLVIGAFFGYQWYLSRPKPIEPKLITFVVNAPAVTDYTVNPTHVHALRLRFSGSVAPIALVGKEVSEGIQVAPAIAGQWTWIDDRELEFQPTEDWPIGQKYSVTFDKAQVFAEHVLVAKNRFDFDTAAFEAKIAKSEFYQDPDNAVTKKAVIHVHFSHPVDTVDFEKSISLRMEKMLPVEKPKSFVVNYDEHKLNAFIHSEQLAVPPDDTKLLVTLDKGLHAARGGPATAAKIEGAVIVPGLYSLHIDDVSAVLVDNERFEPEQVLVLEASQAVGERDMAKAVSAYVLPKFNPKTPEAQRAETYAWSESEIGDDILQKSQKLNLDAVPAERDSAQTQSFKYRAEPGQYVFVKVAKGLKSFGGYVLGKAAIHVVQVPEYPSVLRFMADGALLSLNGDRRVSILARNVPGMELEIARVLPDQLQHLVTMNYGTYSHPQLGALDADHITERFVKQQLFPENEPGKAHYEGVDLGEYLGPASAGKRGVFLLKLSKYKPKEVKANTATAESTDSEGDLEEDDGDGAAAVPADEESEGDESEEGTGESSVGDTRLVVVSDLGMLVKKSLDGSQDVFVQSIHSGIAVAEASVEIIGKNGQSLLTQTSDRDGRAHFAAMEAYTREKTPAMVVVRKGEDLSFLPLNGHDRRLDYSRFDIGGIRNAKDSGQLSAYLFSDRGIYRPGDAFHVGVIVRAADWAKSLNGIPLEAEIVDPRGVSVERRKLKLGTAGFEEVSYTTQDNAPTGTWNVNLYIVKDEQNTTQIGSTTIQVKDFLPDRMKASAHLSSEVAEGWVKPDGLKALFSLQNLFGTPAQNRRVEASLTLTPAFPSFRSYADYHFFDPLLAKEGYSEPLGDHTTNEAGELEIPLDLAKYGNSTYQLYFLAKGYEADGGRSVAAEAVTLISSHDHLIGAKADGALDFISRDGKRLVNLIAIDPQAKKIEVADLKAAIIERRYVSILTKQESGVYKYESRKKEIAVSEQALSIPASGIDFPLPTATPGNYALVIRNAKNEELNRIEYAVAGQANVTRSLERNAELQLTLAKNDFAPGSDIEIAIRAPYAGSGLITLERDRVYAHAWFKSDTTSSIQKIRVPADFEGNGYVNVQFIRDPASDEIFMSPLSYGIIPFSVNRDARRDAVTVSTPERIKPGETLTLKVKSAQPAQVAVFAVDEGILQVARYKLGDPLDFFFRKRMLEVQTAQILDLILPEFSKLVGMAAPGGDEDNMLGRHLNPFKRKHQKPVAYWSGIIEVKGEKELSYPVPEDFNGKLRIMAVAVNSEKIGIFQNSTTVRGDFVLSPNVPGMVAPGDEFEVSVGVANNLTGLGGKEIPVAVEIKSPAQIEVIGKAVQEISLGELREGVVLYRLRAKDEPGAVTLSFSAKHDDKSARLGVDTSVRPAAPYRTEIAVGYLDQGSAEIQPLRTMFDDYAKREAAISYVPLVLAQGLASYLGDFPHRCTEQLVSQAMPALVLAKRPEFGSVIDSDNKSKTSNPIADLLGVLRSRQNGEGGFGLWTSTPQSDRYVSVYAMHLLLEAKERGWNVPADMMDSGNGYLESSAADESDGSLDGLRDRAYAIYLLTRQGIVTTNYLSSVQKRLQEKYADSSREDLVAAYLAASMQLLKQQKEANLWIAGPEKVLARAAEDAAYHFNRFYDPLVRDSATLYLLARHFPERMKTLSPQALQNIVKPLRKGWYNTLSSAMTILALDAYATEVAKLGEGKLSIAETHADKTSVSIGKPDGAVLRGAFSAAATALKLGNEATLPAWYSIAQSGFDRTPATTEIKDGIEIVREYTDSSGKVLTTVDLGEEIEVRLKIRSTRADGVGNVAIVDLLPGGFEPVLELPPVNSEPNTNDAQVKSWHAPVGLSSSTWHPEYADVRDDRVVIYGTASTDVRQFVYRIKATNAGTFVVPPAYGESMYDRTVQARSLGGKISVVKH